jgi:zinc protease
LDEGTDKYTGPQIAEMIEGVGGVLGFTASGGSVKMLAPDRALGLKLLFECLSKASFPKDALERERKRLLNEIADQEKQPEARARRVFRSMVYGKHPYARPSLGVREDVEKLTREDLERFHRKLFVPDNTVVGIVGDFNSAEVIEEVRKLTVDWKKAGFKRPTEPKVEKPVKFEQKILTMPDASQLHFYLGHVGITRNNPDYYKLLVMDYVLGTGTGFTDRLSSSLRDRQGLAYTVSANITSTAGEEPGVFTCYIGTNPKNFEHVKKSFLAELARIRNEPPTAEEVDGAKKYLLGSLPFRFTTNARIAEQLISIERNKLGFSYLDDFRKAVASVTPDEVQAVAKKYLDPEHMVLVAAGAIDGSGKVVAPPP